MAATVKVTFETAEARRAFQEFLRLSARDVKKELQRQAGLIVNEAMMLTPPFGKAPSTEGIRVQQKIGKHAVARDIGRLFDNLKGLNIYNENKAFRKYVQNDQLDKATEMLRRMKVQPHMVIKEGTRELHNRFRDRRGRIQRERPLFQVVDKMSLRRLIRERQKKVLYAKAGWVSALRKLYKRYPKGLNRFGAPGSVRERYGRLLSSRIDFSNRVQYIQSAGAELQIMRRAFKSRENNMPKELEKRLKEIARKQSGKRN